MNWKWIDDIGGPRRVSAAEHSRRADADREGGFEDGRADYLADRDYAADPDGDSPRDEGYADGWASAERGGDW